MICQPLMVGGDLRLQLRFAFRIRSLSSLSRIETHADQVAHRCEMNVVRFEFELTTASPRISLARIESRLRNEFFGVLENDRRIAEPQISIDEHGNL